MAVHVHGVELLLLDLLLIGLVLHALQHLVSDVFGQDGQQEFLLHGDTGEGKGVLSCSVMTDTKNKLSLCEHVCVCVCACSMTEAVNTS